MLVLSFLFPVSHIFDTIFVTKCDRNPPRLTHPSTHWLFPPFILAFHHYQLHFGLFHPAFQLCFIYYCSHLWFNAFVMSRDKTWWRHCLFSSSTPPLLLLGGPSTPGWQHRLCFFRYKRFKRGGRQLISETVYPFHPPDDISFITSLGVYIDNEGHIILGVIPTLLRYLHDLYTVTHA